MKKLILLFITIALALSLVGCSENTMSFARLKTERLLYRLSDTTNYKYSIDFLKDTDKTTITVTINCDCNSASEYDNKAINRAEVKYIISLLYNNIMVYYNTEKESVDVNVVVLDNDKVSYIFTDCGLFNI